MVIDFNNAGEQKESNYGPIPAKSLVKVKLEIKQPKAGKEDPNDPAVTVYNSGLKGLDLELTVVSGKFEGVRIWENWFLPPPLQEIKLSKGQTGICNGSFAKMRAVVEASRNLDPQDPAANRTINTWFELNGLEFPVKVGIDKIEPGDEFINNNIAKVITPNMDHFKTVMGGGEVISDEPIPELTNKMSQGKDYDLGADDETYGELPPDDSAGNSAGNSAVDSNIPDWAR